MKRTLAYCGYGNFGYHRYTDENGKVFVDAGMSLDPRKPSDLHYASGDYEEPCGEVDFEFEVTGWTDTDQRQREHRFDYDMVSSRKSQLDYILEHRPTDWKEHTASLFSELKLHYDRIPADIKPEWITRAEIGEYKRKIYGYGTDKT